MKESKDDRAIEDLSCKEGMAYFKALGVHGMKMKHALKVINNAAYAKKVAEYQITGGRETSLDYKVAKAIMHRNFFGLEEWQRLIGVNPTKRMIEAAEKFPWSVEVLNSPCPFANDEKVLVRDTHIAFLGLDRDEHPLKPRRLADYYSLIGSVHFGINPDRLTKPTCDLRWYLMPIQPQLLTGSGEEWKQKLAKLPEDYEQAYFIEEMTKAIILRAKGVQLNFHGSEMSYGCKDELDHGQVAELLVASPMPQAGFDLKLLSTWPSMRIQYPEDNDLIRSSIRKLLAISVARKLPN